MRSREIPNRALTREDLPAPDAPADAVLEFALTFNGYEHHGSFERCAETANAHKHETLTDLRTCLFFEQRRSHHFGWLTEAHLAEMWALIEMIREQLATPPPRPLSSP